MKVEGHTNFYLAYRAKYDTLPCKTASEFDQKFSSYGQLSIKCQVPPLIRTQGTITHIPNSYQSYVDL